jgi:uncharacterized membrane protein
MSDLNHQKGETMKALFFITALIVSTAAQADIIKCSFTEPFVEIQYSMTQSSLTVTSADEPTYVVKNVSLQILGAGYFELWNAQKNTVVQLSLDFNGSDGMSDYTYPYTAQWNGYWGGCTSNFLHKELSNQN